MSNATRITNAVVRTPVRAASPLAGIQMSEHARLQAERQMQRAEQFVDLILGAVEGWKSLVRRLRSGRVAQYAKQ